MPESSRPISPNLSYVFLACALMNFGGAALFASPLAALRALMGLLEAPATCQPKAALGSLPYLLLAVFFVWMIGKKR